ncbi:AfsR/SARP family transcriptional regulator [Goodfellowiella coeruleoviolacea]|uniref:AfsR/SARP family transcriptional regulator n=1 Tax=Goodfellowiella coeruleoviolacea TaxID=334858 RepID=UPI0020A3664D|nr:AfsR/SARP family transcriptional regulator [Goodfellowiella coeruleoviolacea]
MLGPLEVHCTGTVLDIGGPRQRAVLAALLLRPNALATTDYLCDAVWSRLPASPATNLRTYIAGLRRRLREADGRHSRLRTQPGGYLLEVRTGELDTQVFEQLLAEAGTALRAGAPATALGRLDQGLRLWRTENATSVTGGSVLQAELTRLDELRLWAVESRCDALLALGRHDEASVELRRLVSHYPLREELWARLMTALVHCGRRADALDAFMQARKRLVEELGIEPGPQLERLRQKVLAAGHTGPAASGDQQGERDWAGAGSRMHRPSIRLGLTT